MVIKTARLLSFVIFLAAATSAQDCKPNDQASFAALKNAVRRMTFEHMSISFDEKIVDRAGDTAALAILKTVPYKELTSSDTTKELLSVVRLAFACPSRCVSSRDDRQPKVTLLLLEHLRNSATGQMQSDVSETTKYVLQQASAVD
jgi:hypothetical protein